MEGGAGAAGRGGRATSSVGSPDDVEEPVLPKQPQENNRKIAGVMVVVTELTPTSERSIIVSGSTLQSNVPRLAFTSERSVESLLLLIVHCCRTQNHPAFLERPCTSVSMASTTLSG